MSVEKPFEQQLAEISTDDLRAAIKRFEDSIESARSLPIHIRKDADGVLQKMRSELARRETQP